MMYKKVRNRLERERSAKEPHQELIKYLESDLQETSDQIKWWGVSSKSNNVISAHSDSFQYHSQEYPVLSAMACDYLAIQGSSTASERSFSQGGLTVTQLRNSLSAESVEAVQILKNAYSKGDLAADVEAKKWEPKAWEPSIVV